MSVKKLTLDFLNLILNAQNPEKKIYTTSIFQSKVIKKRYEWDCMATAIYLGEIEIMTILKDKGIEIGKNPAHLEAAILSYRSEIAKEILDEIEDNNEIALNLATFTAIKEEVLPYDEVVFYILKTLQKYYPNILKERYLIDEVNEDNFEEVLAIIGKKRGCIISGGEVDYDKVSNLIIKDLREGRIGKVTFDEV